MDQSLPGRRGPAKKDAFGWSAYQNYFHPKQKLPLLLKEGQLCCTLLEPEALPEGMEALWEKAQNLEETRGAEALWCAAGRLIVREKSQEYAAPLVLAPARLKEKGLRIFWENACANGPLLLLLKEAYGISIYGLDPLPAEGEAVSIKAVRELFSQATAGRKGWTVQPGAELCLVTLEKWFLLCEAQGRKDDIQRQKLTASLQAGGLVWREEPLTEEDQPLLLPFSISRSMRRAVCAAARGLPGVWNGGDEKETDRAAADLLCHEIAAGRKALYLSGDPKRLRRMRELLREAGAEDACWTLRPGDGKAGLAQKLAEARKRGSVAAQNEKRERTAWEQTARRLLLAKKQAEATAAAAHRMQRSGLCFWEAAEGSVRYDAAQEAISFEGAAEREFQRDQLIHWRALCKDLVVAGKAVGHPHGHVFSPIYQKLATAQSLLRAETLMEQSGQAAGRAEEAARELCARLSLPRPFTREEYEQLSILAGAVAELPELPEAWLHTENLGAFAAQVRELLKHGRRAADQRARLLCTVAEPALAIDAQKLLSRWQKSEKQWVVARSNEQNRILRELLPMMRNGLRLEKRQVTGLLQSILSYQKEQALVQQLQPALGGLLGSFWRDIYTDWIGVEAHCRRAVSADERIVSVLGSRVSCAALYGRCIGLDAGLPKAFEKEYEAFSTCFKQLEKLLEIEQIPSEQPWLVQTAEQLAMWRENKGQLPQWIAWRQVRDQAAEAGLLPVVEAYEAGMEHDALEPAFEKGLYQAAGGQILRQEEPLAAFDSIRWEGELKSLASLESESHVLAERALREALGSRLPAMERPAPYSEEALFLRAEKEGLTLRGAVERLPELLTKALPCLMATPAMAAWLLCGRRYDFDLVIADDAQALQSEEMLSLLARGETAVLICRGEPGGLWQEAKELGFPAMEAARKKKKNDEDSPFVKAVKALAEEKGWAVRCGCETEPDLVLEAPREGKRLGLLLDGRFLPLEELFDRVTEREPRLRKEGWNLLALWSAQWQQSPKAVLRRVAETMEALPQTKLIAPPSGRRVEGEEFSEELAPPLPGKATGFGAEKASTEKNAAEQLGRAAPSETDSTEERTQEERLAKQDKAERPAKQGGSFLKEPARERPAKQGEEKGEARHDPQEAPEQPEKQVAPFQKPLPQEERKQERAERLAPSGDRPKELSRRPYREAKLRQETLTAEEILLPVYGDRLRQKMAQVIAAEAPVCQETLIRRTLQSVGIQRAGARLQRRMLQLARELPVLLTEESGRVFYWKKECGPEHYRTFRPGEEGVRRDPAELSAWEMANAAVWALRENGPMTVAGLCRAMAYLMGYQRMGAAVEDAAQRGMERAKAQGRIGVSDGKMTLREENT